MSQMRCTAALFESRSQFTCFPRASHDQLGESVHGGLVIMIELIEEYCAMKILDP